MCIISTGHCPEDWYEYEGRCYKVYGDEADLKNYTDANAFCNSLTITR